MKNKLEAEEVIKLKLLVDQEKELSVNKNEQFKFGLAYDMYFDFSKHLESISLLEPRKAIFIYIQLFTLVKA